MGTKSPNSEKKLLSKQKGNHWSTGLLKAMKDPKLIILEDNLVVAIKDLYPKATFHYLVCCKEDIPTLKSVKFKHLKLMKHMHRIGEELSSRHHEYNFLMGYHAAPSMVRLHLHVISDDFDSPSLKTKKHWNSFTTNFFIPSKKVIEELENDEKLAILTNEEINRFISQPLKCHKCDYSPKHLPDLKHHLKIHSKKP